MSGDARFSPCGRYRYDLTRPKVVPRRYMNFVMLNPSTATAETNDPTITRCMGFARAWGYDGLVVTNLFALRSTSPKVLYGAEDPVGPDNDCTILDCAIGAELIVCAWGNHGSLRGRAARVVDMLAARNVPLHCLAQNKGGQPKHPLYMKGDVTPLPFRRVAS